MEMNSSGLRNRISVGALQEIKRAANYITAVMVWLRRNRPLVWILVAMTFVFMLAFIVPSCLERYIRFSGTALQLLGVILVGIGLRDTRFEDQPTTWESIKQFWAGRPVFRPRHVQLEAQSILVASGGLSAPRLSVTAGTDASLEHRVAALEREHAALFAEVGKLNQETKQKLGELSGAFALERSERQGADKDLKEQLRKAVAGGLPLGRVGAIFFFIGILASSISPEIAGGVCQ
jgi:hypothetical protein